MWDLISLIRDQTHMPCISKRILSYWTTRKVPDKIQIEECIKKPSFASILTGWWPQWRQLKSEVLQSAVSVSPEKLLQCRLSGPTLGLLRQNLHFFKIPRWSVCSLGLKSLEFHEWALRFWMEFITASTPCWSAQCWQLYTHYTVRPHSHTGHADDNTGAAWGTHAVKVISQGRWRRGHICHREKLLSLFVMTLSCHFDQPLQKALINQLILCWSQQAPCLSHLFPGSKHVEAISPSTHNSDSKD